MQFKNSLVTAALSWLACCCLMMVPPRCAADDNPSQQRPSYDLEKRILWTTSRVQGTPDPPDPYRTIDAFPGLVFNEPLALATVPGSSRFAVAERKGTIYTFDIQASPTNTNKVLLLDAGRMILGLALHPDFAENGYLYVTSVLAGDDPQIPNIRVSRYQATGPDHTAAAPSSETTIIEWRADGHRGGCLKFGPDGYLYIGVGDGSGIADGNVTGQDITDLNASILRIDVDTSADGRAYRIPQDNPFVNTQNARGEVWAYGLRQPWKFSFDTATGELWTGDVGQDLWEMVYRVERGGNYGWSVNEGAHPFRPERPLGPTPILPPVVEHPHSDFRSITGGFVYHGNRLANLRGAYIYGDYDTGKIWSLRVAGAKVTEHAELADTQLRIVGFGQDTAGEVYILDFISGAIHQLEQAPAITTPVAFPQKLSETGLFASTKDNQPADGVIPYSVNAPLWSDGAAKERFLALPGMSQIEYNTVTYPQPAPGAQPGWRFPDGTVLVKTFALEMEVGNPASLRRLETRLLHHERIPGTDEVGAQIWHGYTYLWNEEQTDAFLLDSKGTDRTYLIRDANAPGGQRQQTWHFPSRAECTLCHTMAAKYVLGVNTLQMNKDHNYAGVTANQLATFDRWGLFATPMATPPKAQPKLADYRNKQLSSEKRARAYLHANCAHCHRKWGGGNAEFQLLAGLEVAQTGTVNVPPGQGRFTLENPQLLVPGSPERSLIYYRMQKLGLGRMPHIASNIVDDDAVQFVADWIRTLK